jgi:hypothetical protein
MRRVFERRQGKLLGYFLLFLLALAIVPLFAPLNLTRTADPVCQPYRSDPAFLAEYQKEDFSKRFFPDAPAQTPGQKLKSKSPPNVAELAQLEGLWRQWTGAPSPYPVTMLVPFEMNIRAESYDTSDAVKIEFDANGDGSPELVLERGKSPDSLNYIYKEPGNYESTTRIHDRSGKVRTEKIRLRLLSPPALDAELQATWNQMRAALRRGDVTAALNCIHTQSQNKYKEAFALIPDLAKQSETIFGPIRLVEHRKSGSVYDSSRVEGDQTFSLEVRFGPDYDLVWRIRAF